MSVDSSASERVVQEVPAARPSRACRPRCPARSTATPAAAGRRGPPRSSRTRYVPAPETTGRGPAARSRRASGGRRGSRPWASTISSTARSRSRGQGPCPAWAASAFRPRGWAGRRADDQRHLRLRPLPQLGQRAARPARPSRGGARRASSNSRETSGGPPRRRAAAAGTATSTNAGSSRAPLTRHGSATRLRGRAGRPPDPRRPCTPSRPAQASGTQASGTATPSAPQRASAAARSCAAPAGVARLPRLGAAPAGRAVARRPVAASSCRAQPGLRHLRRPEQEPRVGPRRPRPSRRGPRCRDVEAEHLQVGHHALADQGRHVRAHGAA